MLSYSRKESIHHIGVALNNFLVQNDFVSIHCTVFYRRAREQGKPINADFFSDHFRERHFCSETTCIKDITSLVNLLLFTNSLCLANCVS